MRHTKIGSTTHAEHGCGFAVDVMMATYLRIMVMPWACPGHKNVCEVVVYKSNHKADEEPILTVRYTESRGQMVLMDEALAEKVAKKIQANPYRYLRYEIMQNEVI
nr:MAG TPA: hypothetical protein [Caudoviricetes sp.]DAW25927.1 MAG TPA: hypothetical protein [Caudoviricetes sp.]